MGEIVHIDRSAMSKDELALADTPIKAISPDVLKAPKLVARVRGWHGARVAMQSTIEGAAEWPQIAMRYDMPDGSSVAMKLLTEPEPLMPPEIDENSGHYPLIKVLVIDNGVIRPNDADRAWTEVEKYALGRHPLSIVGTSVSDTDSRRAHYWSLEV